jgi:hypothetical protein
MHGHAMLTGVFDVQRENTVVRIRRSVLAPDNIDRILLERYKLRSPRFERFLETFSIHYYRLAK